tara:strand:+ start:1876 stop:2106 length:231 start_codon:yes stop_codon:yes gene_type:complete
VEDPSKKSFILFILNNSVIHITTMDDILDMVISDASPSEVSDKIKDLLYAKTAERVEALRPEVSNGMFDGEGEVED